MQEIFILTIFSALLFVAFSATFIPGLLKKRKKLLFISLVILLPVFIAMAAYTGYRLVSKSYSKVSGMMAPRTGEEIYAALFGKPQFPCVKVTEKQDQVVPKIDYAIMLHFKTCPGELKRILSLHEFQLEKLSAQDLEGSLSPAGNNWFKPALLGDTIWVYNYKKDDYGNGQTIYSNPEFTEAYCMDILD